MATTKTKLSDRYVGTSNGTVKILDWIKGHGQRNHTTFNQAKQLEIAKKIAATDCNESRELMLSLLQEATYLQKMCNNLHDELEIVHSMFLSIDAEESKGR